MANAIYHRFFERMMKSFKREQWGPIVWEIDNLWYDCAQRTGEVETAARLLFDLMSSGKPLDAMGDAIFD